MPEVGIEPTREAVEMRVPKVPFWISLALSLLLAVLIAACVKWLVFEFVLPLARVATGRQILRPVISAGDILVTSVVIVCTVGSLLGSAKSSRATSTNSKPSRVSWSAGCAGSSNPDHKFQTSFSSPRPPFMSTVCAYVSDYEQQLSVVVGEEDYTQRVFDRNLVGREVPRTRRRLRSEFAILRLPTDEKRWIGVRDVLEVDGRRIPDRAGRLTALLKLPFGAAEVQWRALEEESARFNIGNVVRTLNVPTFVLLFLRCDNLRRLEFDARQPDGGEVVVDYREMQRPTFIRDAYGEDELARGFVRANAASGAVLATRLEVGLAKRDVRAQIDVQFKRDAKLQLLVPSEMREQYWAPSGERVEGVALYRNFKRFEVEASWKVRP